MDAAHCPIAALEDEPKSPGNIATVLERLIIRNERLVVEKYELKMQLEEALIEKERINALRLQAMTNLRILQDKLC